MQKFENEELGVLGLVGHTGFVGGELSRQYDFKHVYNSKTINDIVSESFDVLICAGAPATMWAANANPEGDKANLCALASNIAKAKAGKLVLISTIAVFDDTSAGYTEVSANYENIKPYGKHRRELEEHILENHDALIVRLPAVFGTGLKKNFIFDIMNPLPSFIKPDKFKLIYNTLGSEIQKLLELVFEFDDTLAMYKLDRNALNTMRESGVLIQAFENIGFLARNFTNSESQFQYYCLSNLKNDIDAALNSNLETINICTEPWLARDLHLALTGETLSNVTPPKVIEDVRTEHANIFGTSGPYLYSRMHVLNELKEFMERTSPLCV